MWCNTNLRRNQHNYNNGYGHDNTVHLFSANIFNDYFNFIFG